MFSRLTQGVTSVLQELSGEERPDGDPQQDGLVPQPLSGGELFSEGPGPSVEVLESLAQTEQLVVQLKELIREKDSQLASAEKQLKDEKEQGEAKFTKLKLQAKAKMAALNKQISELKGKEGLNTSQTPDSSFTAPPEVEEELLQLKQKLIQEESANQSLQEQLRVAEQHLKEKEEDHAEQVRVLQAVVKDKDVRFQEQILKHEEELVQLSSQASNEGELKQALRASQRRIEELEESLRSRSEVLEMLQQELNSADQQKQILTTQFREMELELTESHRLREEDRKQLVSSEQQLETLRASLKALENEREQAVSAVEAELVSRSSELEEVRARLERVEKEQSESAESEKEAEDGIKAGMEAELASLRVSLEASETQREEVTRTLEVEVERRVAELHHLQEKLDAVEREREEAVQGEREEITRLQVELESLRERMDAGREEQEAGMKAKQALEKLWRGLHSLTGSDGDVEEEGSIPVDPAQVLPVLEARLDHLREKQQEREGRMSQITLTLETLQGQLDKSTAEGEEAVSRIQQLEQQLTRLQVPDESLGDQVTDLSVRDLDGADRAEAVDDFRSGDTTHNEKVLTLEQQLIERERELSALREKLASAEQQGLQISTEENAVNIMGVSDSPEALPSPDDDAPEEETTLIAIETSGMSTSVLSSTAENESSPEIIGPQPESPGELKGTSSDEMVTSSDSDVAHSSWTLLEAINQDGGQEWPPQVQNLDALQLSTQSWEETTEEQVTSTCSMVAVESSSVVIRETVQVHISQQEANLLSTDSSSGQAFAHVLAEELQKRYSELLAELQQLKDTASESEEKVHLLEEELKSLTAIKDEAEARAQRYEQDLMEAKADLQQEADHLTSERDQQSNATKVLEKKIEDLQMKTSSKDQEIQTLQADLEELQQKLAEKEGQARMLGAHMEERERASSELEEKLIDLEAKIQQVSQEADFAKAALIDKVTEVEDLQERLSMKDQEMMDLSDTMTAKLLQAGEEKYAISNEVKQLKEQMLELEKTWDDQQKVKADKIDDENEVINLRKENESLASEIATMKKDGEHVRRKLQAALVQRKELLKKIAGFEKAAEVGKQKDMVGDSTSYRTEESNQLEVQKLEASLQETRQVLVTKEESLIILEQKILNQDQALAEAQAEIQRLIEEAQSVSHKEQQMLQVEDNVRLQSQVASMESELETLQRKLQEAVDSRKDTLRKAKEKDRHHREQLRQQKEEYNDLQQRFEAGDEEKAELLNRLKDLESLLDSKEQLDKEKLLSVKEEPTTASENLEKPGAGDWVQEDWVDFAAPESEHKPQRVHAEEVLPLQGTSEDYKTSLNSLQEELKAEQAARVDLEIRLQESQASLTVKESVFLELSEELNALRVKEKQIDALSQELNYLREKCQQAEAHAEMLKTEVEEAAAVARASMSNAESPVATLQQEVDEFKQFLQSKNDEIVDLSQQLSEQSVLLQKMQETVLEKDHQIASLKEGLKAEQERSQKLESEIPQKQEEDKDNSAKLQQLQRKLQAALVSRKEALKENQALKEELAAVEKMRSELQSKLENGEAELNKLRAEKDKLIEEVDRALLENQSLGATCESLKLAMDGLLNEKDQCQHQAESAKEEAKLACRQMEEKVQGMKDEYETLLKSYENVSDEAERVRKVLEAARQERQESATKARAHEAAKLESERLAEEARKEVDSVKDKMRKFAKAKQQKIMELEEENEKLREQIEKKEKKGNKEENLVLEQQLEKVTSDLEALKANFDIVDAERKSLGQECNDLKQKLATEMERKSSETSGVVVEEEVVAQQSSHVFTQHQEDSSNSQSQTSNIEEAMVVREEREERLKQLEAALKVAENNLKELQEALTNEKATRAEQESLLNVELSSLKHHLQESSEREDNLKEECIKRETQLQELRARLEAEKDDLEEQLMNQLAQVNGSIAGYQQEAADSRDRLADLKRELEKTERERAELEAAVASERDRAARFEEDRRQALRERAEAEAEAGKQRELEQKLKSAQRFKEGSQNRARQLEELLREKQLEVRQMQKDCIKYQERISELDKEVKALLLGKDEVGGELETARQEIANISEERTKLESEVTTLKAKLDMAQGQASQALADKAASEQLAQKCEAELKAEAERTLDEVRYRLGAELKQMELRLEQAYSDREREEEATLEARKVAENADRYAQDMQARLDESLARLAAFSRSMSSLQDDRDRVLDEAKQWENRFHSALQGKEAELREAESRAKDLSEQLQRESTQKEKLQSSLERLEKAEQQWQLEMGEAEKKHSVSLAALEKERAELQERLTQTESSLAQTRSQCDSLEAETEGLRHRAKALEEAVGKLQGEANQARAEIKERETEERRLCLSLEQLETDLRSCKNLTEILQAELAEKEKREVDLLGEKEQAVTQAVEEARKDADSRAEEAEKQLEERRSAMRDLEERLHKAQEDASHSKARLDSFTKAMGSLQDDRDRVLSQYKQLEERHLQVMMEKDGLIQEAAAENNGLKEELRGLLAQRDDLHAENAKLAAQLHGYRDELKQVLTMKESQQKQLLSAQLERISVLEKERTEFQARIEVLEKEASVRKGPAVEREVLSQAGQGTVHDAPGAEVEKLREQLQAARKQISTLEETLESERDAQAAHSKELKELRWEGGILRTETETAEERVAELARDLVEMEQKLLAEREEAAQLKSQNQAFGQAMASLQDSRDQAISEAKELRLHLEESQKTVHSAAPSSSSGGEVWSLKNALSALQNDRERMVEQLQIQRVELDRLGSGELARLTETLEKERRKAGETEKKMKEQLKERDNQLKRDTQELENLKLERSDWQAQAELLKQQTLASLSERDQQVRQLSAMLEEARAAGPKLLQEHAHRQGTIKVDSAPGGPMEHSEDYKAECFLLQRRLDEEVELRLRVEEQLSAARDHLTRFTQDEWHSGLQGSTSETSVLIEPPEGTVTRTRSGGPGLLRILRGAFCSRQRTPLLVSVYLLTVHILLLLCMGGYL